MQQLGNGHFAAGPAFIAGAAIVSYDGSQVVGVDGAEYVLARWTAPGDIEVLQPQSYFPQIGILPNALSLDGGTIVGTRTSNVGHEAQAVRWTSFGDGQLLGTLPGDADSSALAVSADGSVVAGISASRISVPGLLSWGDVYHPFQWTAASGMVALPCLPGGDQGRALAVSGDGSVIVGSSNDATGTLQAVRWTAGGVSPLGILPGQTSSEATGISADGSVIVGSAPSITYGLTSSAAWIWDAAHGMRSLQDVLTTNYGLGNMLAGMTVIGPVHLSADGRTMAGVAVDLPVSYTPQPFLVTLNAPGDANGDGKVTGADYTAWADHFGQSTALFADGDFNSDGKVTGADYTIWADHFQGDASQFRALSVPEPSTLLLGIVGAIALFVIRGRQRAFAARR